MDAWSAGGLPLKPGAIWVSLKFVAGGWRVRSGRMHGRQIEMRFKAPGQDG